MDGVEATAHDRNGLWWCTECNVPLQVEDTCSECGQVKMIRCPHWEEHQEKPVTVGPSGLSDAQVKQVVAAVQQKLLEQVKQGRPG